MFTHLTDFSHRRSQREAFGFFIVYFACSALIGAIFLVIFFLIGPRSAPPSGISNVQYGFFLGLKSGAQVGLTIAPVFMGALAITILNQKGLLRHLRSWVVAILAILLGPFMGLILLAYLTTRENKPVVDAC